MFLGSVRHPFCTGTACVLLTSMVGCGPALSSSETTSVDALQPAAASGENAATHAIVVDNDSAGFSFWTEPDYHALRRHAEAWISSSDLGEEGFMGVNYLKTRAGYSRPDGSSSVNGSDAAASIIWSAALEPGTYDVEVTVSPSRTNTHAAIYCITREEPAVILDCVPVNQRASSQRRGAHGLGRYLLDKATKVWLDPAASASGSGDVIADSVRFIKVN